MIFDEVLRIADHDHFMCDVVPDMPVHILAELDPSASRNRYVPEIRKAQRQLGLSALVPLAQAICHTGAAATAAVASSAPT